MQRIPSTDTDLSDREIERVIEQAKIARIQFLHDQHGRALKTIGVSVLACGFAFLLVVGAGSPRHQTLENTVRLERLASNLAHAQTVSPDAVREISQLLRRPDYDCGQIACDPWLERRNLAARNRLQMIVARDTLQADAASK